MCIYAACDDMHTKQHTAVRGFESHTLTHTRARPYMRGDTLLMLLFVQGAVVLLYLVIRLVTWSGEQSGTMGLGGKRCYHVFGYTRDPMYQRLKCWARELYKEVRYG